MTAASLEAFILERIPLARQMGLSVLEAHPERVCLHIPLAPNLNVHGTLFGGSGASLCLIAAWSLVHLKFIESGLSPHLVVREHQMRYSTPVTGAAQAVATWVRPQDPLELEKTLRDKGRARTEVWVSLQDMAGVEAAELQAGFSARLA